SSERRKAVVETHWAFAVWVVNTNCGSVTHGLDLLSSTRHVKRATTLDGVMEQVAYPDGRFSLCRAGNNNTPVPLVRCQWGADPYAMEHRCSSPLPRYPRRSIMHAVQCTQSNDSSCVERTCLDRLAV